MAHFITPSLVPAEYLNTEISDLTDDEDAIDLDDNRTKAFITTNGVISSECDDIHSTKNQSDSVRPRSFRATSHHVEPAESRQSSSTYLDNISHRCDASYSEAVLNGIFTVDTESYDVSLFHDRIIMELIGVNRKSKWQ